MTLSQTNQSPVERAPYEKPAMRSISLVADQVLGVGCKSSTSTPPAVNNAIGCLTTLCSQNGS